MFFSEFSRLREIYILYNADKICSAELRFWNVTIHSESTSLKSNEGRFDPRLVHGVGAIYSPSGPVALG